MHVKKPALTIASEGSTTAFQLDRPGGLSNRRSMRGQSLVEFAMIAPLFFFLLFGVVDFGRLFFVQMTLQNAVRQAGRFAITGNHLQDPKNPGQNLSRVNSIIKIATEASAGLDISGITISSAKGGPGSAGGPGDTVTVSITDNLKLITPIIAQFFPSGTYRFTVGVTFKNETFSPAQSN